MEPKLHRTLPRLMNTYSTVTYNMIPSRPSRSRANKTKMTIPYLLNHQIKPEPASEFESSPIDSVNVIPPVTKSSTKHTTASRKDSKEDRKRRLQLAMKDLDSGQYKNIHSAASAYDVNYNSLKNVYYKINGKDENSQRLSTSEREKRIKRAIDGFKGGKYGNLTEASKQEKVCAETVRNRYHGRTQSFSEAKRKP